MSKSESDPSDGKPPQNNKKQGRARLSKKIDLQWALIMLGWTIMISMVLSFLSSKAMSNVGYIVAFVILGAFICLGIFFDVIGMSAASASEKPFHSMAARKVPGAFESLRLVRKADKVSSFCNDVVGDISGIISGTTSAVIVTRMSADFSFDNVIVQLLVSGVVAGLTVGGKALGKGLALNYNVEIIHMAGRFIHLFNGLLHRRAK